MKGLKPRTHLTLLRFMQGGVGETWLQALNPVMKQETKLQHVKLNYFGSLTVQANDQDLYPVTINLQI